MIYQVNRYGDPAVAVVRMGRYDREDVAIEAARALCAVQGIDRTGVMTTADVFIRHDPGSDAQWRTLETFAMIDNVLHRAVTGVGWVVYQKELPP